MEKLSDRLKEADKSSKILNATKPTRITKKHFYVLDEIYEDFYKCPMCGYNHLMVEHSFCPNCGIKISFSKSIRDGE